MRVYANLDSHEGSVSGTATVTLLRNSGKLVVTNDSATQNLQFKFNASETYATLKPTETLSVQVHTKEVLLSGSGSYRIWSFG